MRSFSQESTRGGLLVTSSRYIFRKGQRFLENYRHFLALNCLRIPQYGLIHDE
ncbi:hypothetical protein Plhal304r1_c002g0009291 [Plasmopara halstedii]